MRTQRTIETPEGASVHDVTDEVRDAVPVEVGQGLCTVFVPHTTAGVVVNEAEPGLIGDLETLVERLVPGGEEYRHDAVDDNASAHLRSALLGQSVTIPVSRGDLDLGTWQSVLFFEGDGPRSRTLEVTVLSA